MKATELRIGNYVVGDSGTPYRIELSDFADWYNDHNSHEYGDHVKPIPLTEEWLTRFGFVKEKGSYIMGVHQSRFSGLMKFKFDPLDITRVKYVHELQNLYFALTGEEL